MKIDIPAVSIVIPMYNAEKYIGECLESILAQTFQDFEVIVVDDCSTDKSRDIVESYMTKFNRNLERLKLIRSKVNSGGHVGTPRNIGTKRAIGKYIYFMDSDDAFIDDAMENLYNTAEKFGADVVHCDRRYLVLTEQFTEFKKIQRQKTNSSRLILI